MSKIVITRDGLRTEEQLDFENWLEDSEATLQCPYCDHKLQRAMPGILCTAQCLFSFPGSPAALQCSNCASAWCRDCA